MTANLPPNFVEMFSRKTDRESRASLVAGKPVRPSVRDPVPTRPSVQVQAEAREQPATVWPLPDARFLRADPAQPRRQDKPAEPSKQPPSAMPAEPAPQTARVAGPRLVAAWEVDVLDVPQAVADLFFQETLFNQISDRLGEAAHAGLRTMLITSDDAGAGRSTVAIGLAMAASAAGLRVGLVDMDLDAPSLADDLGMDPPAGWLDAIRGNVPLADCAVHAVEDSLTFIPLLAGGNGQAGVNSAEAIQMIELLGERFDLLILDGPAGDSGRLDRIAAVIDGAIIVRDIRRTTASDVDEHAARLRSVGIEGVAAVDNFVA